MLDIIKGCAKREEVIILAVSVLTIFRVRYATRAADTSTVSWPCASIGIELAARERHVVVGYLQRGAPQQRR
jgi:hypothetical protein